MLDTIIPALQDLSRQVLPTLPLLSQEEVSTIWGNVSEFVERQLALHKGVRISGFGTFTFTSQKLEMGNKFILIQRPVFIMAEKLLQTHGLSQNKVYSPGDIPVVPLNFIMISLESPFNRDTVEGCVKETILFLSRSISIKKNVEFTFKGIGVLVIKDGKVKMKFYKDFLCNMDGSGTLIKALANRPNTVDSVLSSREALKRRPGSILLFPRIEHKETENKPPMETIAEEGRENRQTKSKVKDQPEKGDVKETLAPKKIRDKQIMFPTKSTSLPDQFDHGGNGGMNVISRRLAAQRAKYLKDKMEETLCYKTALDAQMKNRPSQLPVFEPDSSEPIFGKKKTDWLVEKRKREQDYMKHQLETAANQKREAILHQLVDQKRDLEMLKRTRKEYLADRTAELERVNKMNQCLQEDWENSIAIKKEKDLEEKSFERASNKLFLLDQCKKYQRCKQCQRCMSNTGKSNLWHMNKFLQGSRLLV
ncbi:coiled-coil domain-containing protein 81 isoform X1 [Marmota marmota marmota]|uniref:coiled-coil domain-containing protein 81 isoform X1 n=1 Tax=Marmota marmota marmota TaxID=9994 RepID=UPI002092DE61|nr:coiled-coil domain-containing protein 81 isoform X1 [Marmota marmota marmota]